MTALNTFKMCMTEGKCDGCSYEKVGTAQGVCEALANDLIKEVEDRTHKLTEYEDLEKQGKLLKLPAAIGDEIFFIFMDCPKDYKEEYCRDHEGSCENCHHRVPEIVSRDFRMSDIPNMDKIFATQEAAEAALKEMSKE